MSAALEREFTPADSSSALALAHVLGYRTTAELTGEGAAA